ncbi:MAG: SHOCT domain-containing protein [Verrucomicrobiota bacterium]
MRFRKQTPATTPARPGAERAAGPLTHRRKVVVWLLIVVSTVLLLVAALTVWVKREVLDTDTFTASTTELMRNPRVQSALATFLVDQIYQNVDVKADLQRQLPRNLKGLAGPASAALNDYGTRAATRLLGTDAVIELVQRATRLAHAEFLRIVDGKPGAGQKVYLQLRPVVLKLAARLGLEDRVAARLPPDAGQFVVLDDSNGTISTVRQSVKVVRALSLFLLLVVVALYTAAIWLARGWRREAILRCGIGVLTVGLLLFVIRHVLQGVLLDALVGERPARPAVSIAYLVLTQLLVAIAWTAVAVGSITVALAFLAGPARVARGFRAFAAPGLVRHPWIAWSADALAILLILIGAPIDDWNKLVSRLVTFAVIIGLTEALRRRAKEEHPDGGRRWEDVDWPWRRTPAIATAPAGDAVGQLERLAVLHDKGAITNDEFDRMKATLVSGARPSDV